jgi:hypothetical protein
MRSLNIVTDIQHLLTFALDTPVAPGQVSCTPRQLLRRFGRLAIVCRIFCEDDGIADRLGGHLVLTMPMACLHLHG